MPIVRFCLTGLWCNEEILHYGNATFNLVSICQ